jgi:hypothetical protein
MANQITATPEKSNILQRAVTDESRPILSNLLRYRRCDRLSWKYPLAASSAGAAEQVTPPACARATTDNSNTIQRDGDMKEILKGRRHEGNLVFCSYLALLLKWELEERMRQAQLSWEWAEVVRGLDVLQEVEANFQGKRFMLRSEVRGHASQALRAAGLALPPTLRELPSA